MPTVLVTRDLGLPAADVWEAVKAIEAYPPIMENVVGVTIIEVVPDISRTSFWSTLLKGSVLEWTELERFDEAAMRMDFDQIDGDLERLTGFWHVEAAGETACTVRLHVDFDIGIPLLADMLNPVAARALAQNSEAMLDGIEQLLSDPV